MRIFVTGASGWIGTPLVQDLLGAGHQVVGLARSDTSAAALAAAGAESVRGTLDDLGLLRSAAADSDGVIHLAFKHDIAFTGPGNFEAASQADRLAVDALAEGLVGSDRPFVLASGTLGLKTGEPATERDMPSTTGPVGTRMSTARAVLDLASRGVRSSVVRLPPTCHGDGDGGFMHMLVDFARQSGSAGYLGDGANRWPAVHHIDVAHLFRLAVEKAPAGSVLHGVAEEGVPIREVAEVIGRHLGVPAVSVAPEQAAERFASLAGFIGVDAPVSSALTRELLGWQPTRQGLLADLDEGHYFKDAEAHYFKKTDSKA
ncbi:SDR family oxidoreductase [Streptomyces sp. NPDC094437]|uniref:SDR family oxidoreductase n=1 Tax=Streptomyces sp. NPDC094437 TaxID=3366060 RepID=UPI0038020B87